MFLGDQHSSARLADDQDYKDRGGEYSGGIQRIRSTTMADAAQRIVKAEERFSETIGNIWTRPHPPIEKPVVLNELLKSLGVNDDSESDSRTAT